MPFLDKKILKGSQNFTIFSLLRYGMDTNRQHFLPLKFKFWIKVILAKRIKKSNKVK
jgi:hypothetical protein